MNKQRIHCAFLQELLTLLLFFAFRDLWSQCFTVSSMGRYVPLTLSSLPTHTHINLVEYAMWSMVAVGMLRKCSLCVVSLVLPRRIAHSPVSKYESPRCLFSHPPSLGPPRGIFSALCLQGGRAVKSSAFLAPSYSAMSAEALCGHISYVPSAGPD